MKRKYVLNNCKIKKKLVLIFIFCVIIPLIFTNSLVLFLVKKYTYGQELVSYNKQVDATEYTISSAISACISSANDMYNDSVISDFLEYKYNSEEEFVSKYLEIINNNLHHYYYGSFMMDKVTVYGDNDTMLSGGYIYRVSEIKNTNWYKILQKMDDNQPILVYTEHDNGIVDSKRKISVIRKLDYYKKTSTCEKIVKIDIDYRKLQGKIAEIDSSGQILVCEGNKILIDNKNSGVNMEDFEDVSKLNMDDCSVHKKIKDVPVNWDIYYLGPQKSFFDMFEGIFNAWEVVLLLILLNLCIPSIIIRIVGNSFIGRIRAIEEKMDGVKNEQFEIVDIETGKDEIGDLIYTYNKMVNKIKTLIEVVYIEQMEKKDLELAKKEAELTALHAQIDPHFLFNILENIRMRSLIKQEDETAEIIGELAIMMRKSCDWGKDMITIDEEVTFARAYLKLQQYRFGDKLSFSFNIAPGCENIRIPKFTIVTFVENAVVHGIEKVTRKGEITVTVSLEDDTIAIIIQDTGQGMSTEVLSSIRNKIYKKSIGCLNDAESIGMLNSFHRLLLNFGDGLEFNIDSKENEGTIIKISIKKDACK